jgi:hypothetical protein
MSKERNKKLVRLGGHLIKERHDIIKEYNEMSRSQGRKQNNLYSDDYDTFVRDIANHIGQYDYFGHQLSSILESSEVKDAFTKEIMAKGVVEYLLNYIGSDKQIDVVNTLQGGIGDYLEKVRPRLPEHIIKYLWQLQSVYDDRGSQKMFINKQDLWDYHIKDEVEERMLDPDWVSENSDDIDFEKRQYDTYWHYPMTSLDWDKDSVYDYYDDYINWYSDELNSFIFPGTTYHSKTWDRLRLTPDFDAIFIDKNEFIENPEGK